MNPNFPILFAVLLIALVGCDSAKTKHVQTQPHKIASFRDNIFESIIPTADGGAYAIGDSALWQLRHSATVKVRFSNLPPDTDDTFFASLEITPLVDGGAQAYSAVDKSAFWHIRGEIAERVTEIPSLSSVAPVAPPTPFGLYVAERRSGSRPSTSQRKDRIQRMTNHKIHTDETHYPPLHYSADAEPGSRFSFAQF